MKLEVAQALARKVLAMVDLGDKIDAYPMVAPAYSELRARIAKQQAGGSRSRKREG
jgi:predicted transcriptional regulator